MIPLFATHIPPNVASEVSKLINTGWINRGKKAALFEEMFLKQFQYQGYALSVNSCTSALRLAYAILANMVGTGEIITTPYTMVATNTAMLECNFKPVFADIEYETANIDPYDIERHITRKTKAITVVHYAGYPCNMREIEKIAYDNKLFVIEDCAQALGAKRNGLPVGHSAEFACFSFQAIKHITTGDGGMFYAISKDIYELANKMAWFGIDKANRVKSPLGDYPRDIELLGFKYAMNDIAAVMGIEGLKDIEKVLRIRREITRQYREGLSKVDGITLMRKELNVESAEWMFPIHVRSRLGFAEKMRECGIEVAVHNWRNDKYSIFGFGGLMDDLPNTERLNSDLIHIPLHAELAQAEVDYIIETIRRLMK